MLYYVYILKCSDQSYYTGITNNLDKRLLQHQSGYDKDSYTYSRRPLELVFFADFTDPNSAIEIEKRIKGWSRSKKEALINGDFKTLVYLSNLKNSIKKQIELERIQQK